jgi:hypothetical protein
MKATLTFNLPEEQEQFEAAVEGEKAKRLISELYDEVFRKWIKYEHKILDTELSERDYAIIEEICKQVREHFYNEEY